jgi:hypothetical protein
MIDLDKVEITVLITALEIYIRETSDFVYHGYAPGVGIPTVLISKLAALSRQGT